MAEKMLNGDFGNNFDDLISRNFCRFADECADLQQLLPTESGWMFDIYTRRVVDFSSDKNVEVSDFCFENSFQFLSSRLSLAQESSLFIRRSFSWRR
jgi:hypothetical protein